MKKLLSVLLVIAIAATFFAGCGEKTPAQPTPTPVVNAQNTSRPTYEGDVIEFRVYNIDDFQVRWENIANIELLETRFKLRALIDEPVAVVPITDLSTSDNRAAYNLEIAKKFQDKSIAPDFLPTLMGTAFGSDAVWKEIGPEYLVDLAPYIGQGGILQQYVDFVWGGIGAEELGLWDDQRAYWEIAKETLMDEGKLYVLPRRECMPMEYYMGYSQQSLTKLEREEPKTWSEFTELLKAMKADKKTSTPFIAADGKGANVLSFIASTYGLDFNESFEWTQKNGEPLWTYYWDEYLEILKIAKSWAAEGLTTAKSGILVSHDMDYTTAAYGVVKKQAETAFKSATGVVGYNTASQLALFASHGGQGASGWYIAHSVISQDGYKASRAGTSQFDTARFGVGGYIAIANMIDKKRGDDEFTLRLLDYIVTTGCTADGYLTYCFGKEGSPFIAPGEEGSGTYIVDENGKFHMWWGNERMGWENSVEIFTAKEPLAAIFADEERFPESLGVDDPIEDRQKNYGSEYGVDTLYLAPELWVSGIFMFADITTYPMSLTAYWEESEYCKGESWSRDGQWAAAQLANSDPIYAGMWYAPKDALGTADGAAIQTKINNIAKLAKDFTVKFLAGEVTESGWDGYIRSLNDAGYNDVYEYYKNCTYGYITEYDASVKSQSSVTH